MASRPPGFPVPDGFFDGGQNADVLAALLTRLMEYNESKSTEDRAYTDAQILAGTPQIGANNVWVVESSAAASALGNGVTYTPLRQGQADSIEVQFLAGKDAPELTLVYAMSAADAGDVELRLDVLSVGDGDDPATALGAGTPFTVTPGSDTNRHSADKTDSAEMALSAVSAGDLVRVKITRPTGGADTHTGDLRALDIVVA